MHKDKCPSQAGEQHGSNGSYIRSGKTPYIAISSEGWKRHFKLDSGEMTD